MKPDRVILMLIWKKKELKIAKKILKIQTGNLMYNILSSYRSQNSMILGKNGWEVMESFEINLSIYDILTFDFFFFFFAELCGT